MLMYSLLVCSECPLGVLVPGWHRDSNATVQAQCRSVPNLFVHLLISVTVI